MRFVGRTLHGIEMWESIADAPKPVEAFIRIHNKRWFLINEKDGTSSEVTFEPSRKKLEDKRIEVLTAPCPATIIWNFIDEGGSVRICYYCYSLVAFVNPKDKDDERLKCTGCGKEWVSIAEYSTRER